MIRIVILAAATAIVAQPLAAQTEGTDDAKNSRGAFQIGEAREPMPRGKGDVEKDAEHETETENLFGFTVGSDTEEAGAVGLAVENVTRFGKRDAKYFALGQKIELAYGATDNLSVSAALLGDFHRVRPYLGTATFEEVRGRYIFNGVGGELRYRLLDRRHAPFGLTLHLEPSFARSDDVSGLRGRKFATENKVIFDRALVDDTVFAALNLLHEMEWMRGNAGEIERGAKIGASLALAFRIHPQVFVGMEARYLRAYDGLGFKTYLGDAIHVGPSVSAKINDKLWINLAYGGLVGGREKGSDQRFDLVRFEKHQIRLKAGYEF